MARHWGFNLNELMTASSTPTQSITGNTTITSEGIYFLDGGGRHTVTIDVASLTEIEDVIVIKARSAAGDIVASTGGIDGINAAVPMAISTTFKFVVSGGALVRIA